MPKEHIQRWHGAHHYSDKVHLLLIVFIIFGIFTLLWSYFTLSNLKIKNQTHKTIPATEQSVTAVPTPTLTPSPTGNKIFCTQEAKLCPDGKTYVGRTGPNCEFAKCP